MLMLLPAAAFMLRRRLRASLGLRLGPFLGLRARRLLLRALLRLGARHRLRTCLLLRTLLRLGTCHRLRECLLLRACYRLRTRLLLCLLLRTRLRLGLRTQRGGCPGLLCRLGTPGCRLVL